MYKKYFISISLLLVVLFFFPVFSIVASEVEDNSKNSNLAIDNSKEENVSSVLKDTEASVKMNDLDISKEENLYLKDEEDKLSQIEGKITIEDVNSIFDENESVTINNKEDLEELLDIDSDEIDITEYAYNNELIEIINTILKVLKDDPKITIIFQIIPVYNQSNKISDSFYIKVKSLEDKGDTIELTKHLYNIDSKLDKKNNLEDETNNQKAESKFSTNEVTKSEINYDNVENTGDNVSSKEVEKEDIRESNETKSIFLATTNSDNSSEASKPTQKSQSSKAKAMGEVFNSSEIELVDDTSDNTVFYDDIDYLEDSSDIEDDYEYEEDSFWDDEYDNGYFEMEGEDISSVSENPQTSFENISYIHCFFYIVIILLSTSALLLLSSFNKNKN